MFKAIARADLLADIVDATRTLVDEVKFNLTQSGIEIRAVDPANVAMVDLTADAAGFESYEADGGVIGVNLDRLGDAVAMAESGDDLVHLRLDTETRKLHVEIGGLEMTMATIDPDSIRQEPDLPDLDLAATVAMQGSDVSRMVTAADLVSDHLALGADASDEVFYAEADGDTDDVRLELDAEDLLLVEMSDDAHSLFSLDYLKDLQQPIPKDTEVSVRVGEEFPTKLRYSLGDDGDGGAAITVENMVAPRIKSE